MIQQPLDIRPREMPAQAHSVSQSFPKIVDVAALALGFVYLLRGPHDGSPAEPVRQRGTFEPAVSGKHIVRKLRGRGHNVLKCYNELLVHKGAEDELHIGEAHNRVVSEAEERLDGIRCPIRHGSESGRGVCHIAASDQISVFVAPNPLCRFSQRGGAAICKCWVGISAELLCLLLLGKNIVQLKFRLADDGWVESVQYLASGNVEIDGEGAQRGLEADGGSAVTLLVCDR